MLACFGCVTAVYNYLFFKRVIKKLKISVCLEICFKKSKAGKLLKKIRICISYSKSVRILSDISD